MMAAREIQEADLGAEPRELTDEQRASADFARAIFERAQPIDGVLEVAGYLAVRGGLDVSGCKSELRYSPDTPWGNERRKCLLVAYRSLETDEITGISRILVDEPERWPKTQRKMLGVVRLAAAKLARRLLRRLLSPKGSRLRLPRTRSATARVGRLAQLALWRACRCWPASSG